MNIDKDIMCKAVASDQEKKRTITSSLISGICRQDLDMCREASAKLTKLELNRCFRLVRDTTHYAITPLIFAIFLGHNDVVDHLISRGADLEKKGHIEEKGIMKCLTPLLLAIYGRDVAMLRLLLSRGANVHFRTPAKRLIEEEGGHLYYDKWIYTINEAFATENVDIIECVLDHWDLQHLYGTESHTCLCQAVHQFIESRNKQTSLGIVRSVLRSGGQLCYGGGDRYFGRPGEICEMFSALIESAFPLKYGREDLKVELHCCEEYFQCLKLICYSDYAHVLSIVYRTIHEYEKFFLTREFSPHVADDIVDKFNWFMSYSHTPSSLKHICGVVIRQSVRKDVRKDYTMLQLPVTLQQFLLLGTD